MDEIDSPENEAFGTSVSETSAKGAQKEKEKEKEKEIATQDKGWRPPVPPSLLWQENTFLQSEDHYFSLGVENQVTSESLRRTFRLGTFPSTSFHV